MSADAISKQALPVGILFYSASKKFAEMEAWSFYKEKEPKWTLATMNPVVIWGPSSQFLLHEVSLSTDWPVHPLSSLSNAGFSTENIYNILKGPKDAPILPTFLPHYVDVSPAESLLVGSC